MSQDKSHDMPKNENNNYATGAAYEVFKATASGTTTLAFGALTLVTKTAETGKILIKDVKKAMIHGLPITDDLEGKNLHDIIKTYRNSKTLHFKGSLKNTFIPIIFNITGWNIEGSDMQDAIFIGCFRKKGKLEVFGDDIKKYFKDHHTTNKPHNIEKAIFSLSEGYDHLKMHKKNDKQSKIMSARIIIIGLQLIDYYISSQRNDKLCHLDDDDKSIIPSFQKTSELLILNEKNIKEYIEGTLDSSTKGCKSTLTDILKRIQPPTAEKPNNTHTNNIPPSTSYVQTANQREQTNRLSSK